MSLSANALADADELKAFIGASGTGKDKELQQSINTASAIIETYLGRQIVSLGSLTEYHTFWTPQSELYLRDWPALTVTSVSEDVTRSYSDTLTVNEDYIISKPTGTLIRVGANAGQQAWAIGFRAIKVVYTAGYDKLANVPADIKDAAMWIAAHLFQEAERKGWDVSTQTDGLGTVTRFTLSRLPDYMKSQLAPYRIAYRSGMTGERDA